MTRSVPSESGEAAVLAARLTPALRAVRDASRLPRRHRSRARVVWLGALGVGVVASMLTCATLGGVSTPLSGVAAWLASPLGLHIGVHWTTQQESVLLAVRLPRVILAALVGAGLGVSGATMQGIFRNPLVDPGLLGVSSGAALGAVLAILVGDRLAPGAKAWAAPHLLSLAAFAGSLLAMWLVKRIARADRGTVVGTLLLAGIAINALASALTGLCIYSASDSQLRSITFWSLGSLGGATWSAVFGLVPFVLLPTLALPRLSHTLNALLLGDADARSLGFNVDRARNLAVGLVALIVGASVAVSGVLGFVGLVVPHLARLAGGSDHRFTLPGSALLGAILLLWSDALARTVALPAELPLGIVTASMGAPFFLALLMRERRGLA